ncbi:MAG: SpoIIE family protein phosphatase [Oscillospiraceae bacterium]|nr:SpoIIE family protein phosphatase [Oscillospiraceae bacterium]
MKTHIKTKILRAFLILSIGAMIVAAVSACATMFYIRGVSIENNNSVGHEAAGSGETALIDLAIGSIGNLAEVRAEGIETGLNDKAKLIQSVADYISYLYTHKDDFKRIEYPNGGGSLPPGELAMAYALAGEDMTIEEYGDEIFLHGNLMPVFDAIMKANSDISTFYCTTDTGISEGYDAYPQVKPAIYDGRGSSWYIKAKESGGLVVSDTYQDSFGRGLTVSMSYPCYGEGGKFVAVVSFDILLEDLNAEIQQTTVAETGYAMLLSGTTVIAAPDLNEAGIIGEYLIDGESGVADTIIDGKPVYIIWSPVGISDWVYALVVPQTEIIAPALATKAAIEQLSADSAAVLSARILRNSFIMIAIFALTVAALVYVSLRIAGSISKPIIALTSDARIIGDGDLEHTLTVNTGDEIEVLADTFNTMVRGIKSVTAEKERIGAELNIAADIQMSMLPCIFPPFPNKPEIDIFGVMTPAKEVGGDFFDFFLIDEDKLCVVIADVSGKGVPAALFMVIAKILIKDNVLAGKTPSEAFTAVNEQLCENNDAGMFVTAFMGILELSAGNFTYVNAGHNPPLIQRNGAFEWLKAKAGFVLAGMEGMRYTQTATTLKKGDAIFLYTDGVTEALDPKLKLYGDDRLLTTINKPQARNLPAQGITSLVRDDVAVFANGAEQADDITILTLKFFGGAE